MNSQKSGLMSAFGFLVGCLVSGMMLFCGLAAGGVNAYLPLSLAVGAFGFGLAQWPAIGVFILLPYNRKLAGISLFLMFVNLISSVMMIMMISSIREEIYLFNRWSGIGLGIYFFAVCLTLSWLLGFWRRS